LKRDAHQVQTEHAHPAGGVRLFEPRAVRQRRAAINDRDVIKTEKAALEDVVAFAVHLVDPPSEVDHQLVETLFEEQTITFARLQAIHVIDAPHGPSMHRRVEIRELPFVSRYLPIRMLELLEEQEPQLLFRKLRIDHS